MAYINDNYNSRQVSSDDLFLTIELAKESIINGYKIIIEKEQYFIDNIDSKIKQSKSKIQEYEKLIKEI